MGQWVGSGEGTQYNLLQGPRVLPKRPRRPSWPASSSPQAELLLGPLGALGPSFALVLASDEASRFSGYMGNQTWHTF